jgi:signal transduction histidine kinase
VKATVDAYGGDVTLRTAAGQGTAAVRVELPILEGGDQFAGPVPSKQSDRT